MTGSPIRVTHSTHHGTEFNRHLLISKSITNDLIYVLQCDVQDQTEFKFQSKYTSF